MLPLGVRSGVNLRSRTQKEAGLIDLARKPLLSSSNVVEISRSLTRELAIQLPEIKTFQIQLWPNLYLAYRERYGLDNIIASFVINSSDASDCFLRAGTAWNFSVGAGSGERNVSLRMNSYEDFEPFPSTSFHDSENTDNSPPNQEEQGRRKYLGDVHPSFLIHQEVVDHIKNVEGNLDESTVLHLTQLAFNLFDKRYGDKRVRTVKIILKEILTGRGNPDLSLSMKLNRSQYEQMQASKMIGALPTGLHQVYLALGSNLGDRIANIEWACAKMKERGIQVRRTSALYETEAMYLKDQEPFINGACEVCCHTSEHVYSSS